MAVQHAEAPRRDGEQPGAREQDPHDRNRQLPLAAVEAGRDQRDEQRRGEDADEDEDGDDQRQQGGDGAGDAVGLARARRAPAARRRPE